MNPTLRKSLPAVLLVAAAAAGGYAWFALRAGSDTPGLTSGNGRIEATEIDVATKLPGRVADVLVSEGDLVQAGQLLARMEVDSLLAQRDEARARQQQAVQGVAGAEAQVVLRESDHLAVLALVDQRDSELDAARRRLARSETLALEGASSVQELDDDRARARSAEAALAATATIARIETELADADLKAPRAGRVQYRIAQSGEVLAGGGKVLNMVDLSDVYMTFFLPETVAGRVALGTEVRIVLDAAPQFVIPARVSFVASTAQFTPKTVETASERQKLMFRVRAQIDRELLLKHVQQVKTGLPGVAWVKVDAQAVWPAKLTTTLMP